MESVRGTRGDNVSRSAVLFRDAVARTDANLARVATIKQVERAIREREGFVVSIAPKTPSGRPRNAEYEYVRAARDEFTVEDWKRARFDPQYPECEIRVLRPDGRAAPARMTLAKLRSEYAV